MAKTAAKIINLLLIAYLVTFPFGQIAAVNILGYEIHIADTIVVLIAFVHLAKSRLRTEFHFKWFIFYLVFSYIFSLMYFDFDGLLGLLYLGRLISYFILFDAVYAQVKLKQFNRNRLHDLLIYFGTLTSVIGLIQYAFLPDLRFLYELGWDRHHGRLAGLYLDPAFIGILIVFNVLLIIKKLMIKKSYLLYIVFLVNLIALLLTFSRASYLAIIISFTFLLINKIELRKIVIAIIIFIISLNFLPKFSSEGTNLLRTSTITARFKDYEVALYTIQKSPIIGIGFNNLCEYKVAIDQDAVNSHTCSGFDSSILLLIATTGIVGASIFFFTFYTILMKIRFDYMDLIISSIFAVLIHSLFNNSLFYPWVLGWLMILIPSSMKIKE